MAYIDVDKAVFLCLHVRRADAVFMQGKALIDDNQAKALSKAVHGYLISALRYIAFAFLLHYQTHTLSGVYSPVQWVCVSP